MGNRVSDQAANDGMAALSLMEQALQLLDGASFPGEIGADLDHAIWRLRNSLGMLVDDQTPLNTGSEICREFGDPDPWPRG